MGNNFDTTKIPTNSNLEKLFFKSTVGGNFFKNNVSIVQNLILFETLNKPLNLNFKLVSNNTTPQTTHVDFLNTQFTNQMVFNN
jgi:hypothetical protein